MSNLENLKKLREPFAPNQISKLCKPYKKDSEKGKCKECGGYHALPSVSLDYVGHAALTDRLLEVDPEWNWEPVSVGQDGYPVIDKDGGMWIKLTVCGVTRLGYGDAQGKTGGNATKERIGDALRNAAMRFGAALELWHKGDLHLDEDDKPVPKPKAVEHKFVLAESLKWISEGKTPDEQLNRARAAYGKAVTDEDKATIKEMADSLKEAA